MAEQDGEAREPEAEEPRTYRIQRATKFYRDVPVQLESRVERGCAIDSDLYSKGQEQTQKFRQLEDIILLRLSPEELKGSITSISGKHLVNYSQLAAIADQNGMAGVEAMKASGINALFTDHTRIGKLDFVDPEHIASEIRSIDSYTYRHDSTLEEDEGIDASGPSAWKLEGIDVNRDMVYWESMEEYTR
jgi:hypothetical protein